MAMPDLPLWTQICTKCGQRKPQEEFYWNSRRRGFLRRCKACLRTYSRGYVRTPEGITSDVRACTQCGEEKDVSAFYSRVRGGQRRTVCKDCCRAGDLRRHAINPRPRKKYADLVAENPDGIRDGRRRSYLTRRSHLRGWVKINLDTRRGQCRKSGIPFDLSVDDVLALYEDQGGKCALTGAELLWGIDTNRGPGTLSVDRIDALGPYTKENVRLVVHWANIARQRLTDAEFVDLCRAVVNLADAPIVALMIATPKGRA